MGCKPFKRKIDSQRIHLKKLQDIYASYIKNQNKDPANYTGVAALTGPVTEQVSRYAASSVKELIRIIQIDQKTFITKVCRQLVKDCLLKARPLDLRLLSLMLL